MSRTVAVIWHASFCVVAGALYFLFVLPRWWELMGDTSHTLGTVLRIVVGALIGLAALPVVFTLVRTRKPELGTPQLALTLRTWSIVLHVLAGVAIIGAAISEIWLSLDAAGQWLFGIYGAAAAVALLGMLAFYLAYVAELPPPPPRPLKPKKEKKPRRGRRKAAQEAQATQEAQESAEASDAVEETTSDAEEPSADAPEPTAAADEDDASEAEESAETESTNGKLRNRRPSGKGDATRRKRRRLRGGVAVED
jgi:hypothetical protein